MTGSDQYRVVFKARGGHLECRDVLIERSSASKPVILAALSSQHDIHGAVIERFYWVIPRRVSNGKVTRV